MPNFVLQRKLIDRILPLFIDAETPRELWCTVDDATRTSKLSFIVRNPAWSVIPTRGYINPRWIGTSRWALKLHLGLSKHPNDIQSFASLLRVSKFEQMPPALLYSSMLKGWKFSSSVVVCKRVLSVSWDNWIWCHPASLTTSTFSTRSSAGSQHVDTCQSHTHNSTLLPF